MIMKILILNINFHFEGFGAYLKAECKSNIFI